MVGMLACNGQRDRASMRRLHTELYLFIPGAMRQVCSLFFLTIKNVNAHLVIYRWKVGARPGQGQGKKQGSGRQGWDKAEASRIEPKSPNVGQKHGARSGQNKTVL